MARDCVTSVRSYSDPHIQLGSGQKEQSRAGIECRPNAVGVGAKAQYHLRGSAAGARPQRREEQWEFSLFVCTSIRNSTD